MHECQERPKSSLASCEGGIKVFPRTATCVQHHVFSHRILQRLQIVDLAEAKTWMDTMKWLTGNLATGKNGKVSAVTSEVLGEFLTGQASMVHWRIRSRTTLQIKAMEKPRQKPKKSKRSERIPTWKATSVNTCDKFCGNTSLSSRNLALGTWPFLHQRDKNYAVRGSRSPGISLAWVGRSGPRDFTLNTYSSSSSQCMCTLYTPNASA